MNNWIPKYIRKVFDYKSNKVMSAKELNAILNLLVTQGDYNAEWLNYLQTDGIPEAIANLSIDSIEELLVKTIDTRLDALTASVTSKTSRALNNPLFTFIDVSYQTGTITEFRKTLEAEGVVGCITACTGLVGTTSAYPTLQQLRTAQVAGHDILTSGTDVAPLTEATAKTVATNARTYMAANGLLAGQDIIVYPDGGTNNTTVHDIVGEVYSYGINLAESAGYVNPDKVSPMSIPVVYLTTANTINADAVRQIIADTVNNNGWCILAVDTSSDMYSNAILVDAINYIKTLSTAQIVTASHALAVIENTINNLIAALTEALNGCYVDYKDEDGNVTTDKYLHW